MLFDGKFLLAGPGDLVECLVDGGDYSVLGLASNMLCRGVTNYLNSYVLLQLITIIVEQQICYQFCQAQPQPSGAEIALISSKTPTQPLDKILFLD